MAKYTKPLTAKEDEQGGGGKPQLRLPFALCKERGIKLPNWATPSDAWRALRGFGIDPKSEYEEFFKRKAEAERKKVERREKREQMQMPEHNPDYKYEHREGAIAGVDKGEPMTFEQADSGNCNPFYQQGWGYTTNCQTCVVAFEARTRGYDVRALPNLRNGYIKDLSRNPLLAYKGGQSWDYKGTVRDAFLAKRGSAIVNRMKDGERYVIVWTWKGLGCGHIISCFKENGQPIFYDPQTNKKMGFEEFKSNYAYAMRDGVQMKRVDNLEFDDEYVDYIFKKR